MLALLWPRYGRDEIWAGRQAPKANRFIFSYDESNAQMRPFAHFAAAVSEFAPDAVILSGVHQLEPEHRSQRLADIAAFLRSHTPRVPVHLELARSADNQRKKERKRRRKKEKQTGKKKPTVTLCVFLFSLGLPLAW